MQGLWMQAKAVVEQGQYQYHYFVTGSTQVEAVEMQVSMCSGMVFIFLRPQIR